MLELSTVAEGVETEEEVGLLSEMGCDYIQGYYYSKPLLPDDLIKFYRQEDAPNASNDF